MWRYAFRSASGLTRADKMEEYELFEEWSESTERMMSRKNGLRVKEFRVTVPAEVEGQPDQQLPGFFREKNTGLEGLAWLWSAEDLERDGLTTADK